MEAVLPNVLTLKGTMAKGSYALLSPLGLALPSTDAPCGEQDLELSLTPLLTADDSPCHSLLFCLHRSPLCGCCSKEASPSPSALTSVPQPKWQLLMLPVKTNQGSSFFQVLFPLPSRTSQPLSSCLFLPTLCLSPPSSNSGVPCWESRPENLANPSSSIIQQFFHLTKTSNLSLLTSSQLLTLTISQSYNNSPALLFLDKLTGLKSNSLK